MRDETTPMLTTKIGETTLQTKLSNAEDMKRKLAADDAKFVSRPLNKHIANSASPSKDVVAD